MRDIKIDLDIDLLKITHNNREYYGAAQEWYSESFRIKAGCGPTTASNLVMYLALSDQSNNKLFEHKLDYYSSIQMMNEMWDYVTPSPAGLYSIDDFKAGVERYALACGVKLSGSLMPISLCKSKRATIDVVVDFISASLKQNQPLGFLNLSAGKVSNLSSWHWTLVMGVKVIDGAASLVLFDEGGYKEIDLNLWLETTKLKGGFVSFTKK